MFSVVKIKIYIKYNIINNLRPQDQVISTGSTTTSGKEQRFTPVVCSIVSLTTGFSLQNIMHQCNQVLILACLPVGQVSKNMRSSSKVFLFKFLCLIFM